MKSNVVRSPLFYVGDKYKIISEIKRYFPNNIHCFVEPFVGGGSVFMNVDAVEFLLNDLDTNIISIHQMLCDAAVSPQLFYQRVDAVVKQYGLSRSYKEDIVPGDLKREFVKTFYARFNKVGYEKMRSDYNQSQDRSTFMLYMLLIYGFNRMLRFNGKGLFNLPVGNVDYNQNTHNALIDYFRQLSKKQVEWHNEDFRVFLENIEYQ